MDENTCVNGIENRTNPQAWGFPEVRRRKRGRPRKDSSEVPCGMIPVRPAKDIERDEIILRAYLDGMTYREVGNQHGLTGERVRQILGPLGKSISTVRRIHRRENARQKALSNRFRVDFSRSMKAHLWSAGIRRCNRCKLWLGPEKWMPRSKYICRQCNTDRLYHYYGSRPDLRSISPSDRIKILIREGKISRVGTRHSDKTRSKLSSAMLKWWAQSGRRAE